MTAPSSYAVFLRGINVNGINLKMAELKECLTQPPFEGVKTLLATGNVVLSSPQTALEVKARCEALLRERFGYDAWVIVTSPQEIDHVVDATPYPADDPAMHSYVTLASDPDVLDALVAEASAQGASGVVRLSPTAIGTQVAVGSSTEAPVSKLMMKARYKPFTTTRNLRTLLKVQAALG
ncbi:MULTISPECIES: DUF1697 domain-containing protein [Arthrobacter]|uniref:DUF1697 domain-containing protein n=2 Tax=Arthrobacter TaxID=1663 RepID=A0ABU9KNR5_9MICC|nr:DUF1697 domain-containing protein [Arthrobacter sp. YJM1]MDP5228575.1 DUF1697 domain-containing protein [Arthrobacter sp. YJM1]